MKQSLHEDILRDNINCNAKRVGFYIDKKWNHDCAAHNMPIYNVYSSESLSADRKLLNYSCIHCYIFA